MRKGHEIIGKRVIGLADASDLGTVRDLVFDANADQCIGLVLQEGGMMSEAQVVPWEQITTLGPDAVMVQSESSRIGISSDARIRASMEQDFSLSGDRIATTEGNQIGSLGDVYIDEKTGQRLGYEVSGGFVSDTVGGKRYLPGTEDAHVGRDVILVPPHIEGMLEEQAQSEPGGLKASFASAQEKATSAYGTAKDKVTETYGNIAQASVEKQKEFVTGKTAGRDVFLPLDDTNATTETIGTVQDTNSTPTMVSSETTTSTSTTSSLAPTFAPSNESTTYAATPSGIEVVDRDTDVETLGSERVGTMGTPGVAASGASVSPVRDAANLPTGMAFNEPEPASILHPMGDASTGAVTTSGMTTSATTTSPLTVGSKTEDGKIVTSVGELTRGELATGGGTAASAAPEKPHGPLLVAQGETITRVHADRAEEAGILHQLLIAAGANTVSSASGPAQQTAGAASDKAGDLLGAAKERGAGLVETVQQKRQDYANEQERKKVMHALGRPITRVLLAPDDSVILNVGDIITNKAVRIARDGGLLDTLLNSVYDEEPEITPEMMRATQPGEAALPSQAQPTGAPITATVSPEQPSQSTPSQGQT